MTQADNDETNLPTHTLNNHLGSTYENAITCSLEQPCDNCFVENSELKNTVDALNNRTETLQMNTGHLLERHACSQLFQIILL